MKLALAVLVTMLAACSITHHSGEYACVTQSDCDQTRVCSDGFCVVPGGTNPVDAPTGGKKDAPGDPQKDAPEPDRCPMGCSSCDLNKHTCNITCGAPGAQNCQQPITCPTGWNCNIGCDRNSDCRQGINCNNSESCTISCKGGGACRGISCGNGPCDVTCSGYNSCTQNVFCNNSCECDVRCTGPGNETCASNIDCGANACTLDLQGGCTSTPSNVCSSVCN